MSLILLFSLLTSVLSSVLGGVLPNIEQTKSAEHPDDASMAPKEIPLKVYQPVVFDQLCKEESNYCIYVDQVRPGIVQATPVSATDARKPSSTLPILLKPIVTTLLISFRSFSWYFSSLRFQTVLSCSSAACTPTTPFASASAGAALS